MLILAADTSGKNGSLALARVTAGRPDVEVIEVVPLTGGAFSAQMVPQISALLAKHGYNKSDLGGLAVVSGPGSFTGLRVGLAAIKALAEALRIPIATVSLLEAVARLFPSEGRIVAALDAGRNEVYFGDYEAGAHLNVYSERLLTQAEFIEASKGKILVTPDPAVANIARGTGIEIHEIPYPQTDVIARLGWARMLRGETVPPEALDANYIRRSDAEIFSPPKA